MSSITLVTNLREISYFLFALVQMTEKIGLKGLLCGIYWVLNQTSKQVHLPSQKIHFSNV